MNLPSFSEIPRPNLSRQYPTYSGLPRIPAGEAARNITPGCLVVEGGAFRGTYVLGVMDRLMETDLNFQCTIGVSAGAMGGLNYVSGQIGRSARVNLTYRHDPRYISFRHRKQYHGFVNFDFCLRQLSEEPFDMERFSEPERRYVAVATNCATGEPEYFERTNCTDILKAVEASASMPYISDMVDVDGKLCLDGGCSVHIPFEWAMEQGYEKIVVIKTRHRSFRYEEEKPNPLAQRLYRDYPDFADRVSLSNLCYNADCNRLQKLEDSGRLFVIAPSVTWYAGRLEKDMEKLGRWYWQGYQDADASLPALREYLDRT